MTRADELSDTEAVGAVMTLDGRIHTFDNTQECICVSQDGKNYGCGDSPGNAARDYLKKLFP